MWLVFMLAAIAMLVSGIAGSVIVKSDPSAVPEGLLAQLPLLENIAYGGGTALALFGVALCYRKLGRIARAGSASGRLRRTRMIERPGREAAEQAGAARDSERETISDASLNREPTPRRLRRLDRG